MAVRVAGPTSNERKTGLLASRLLTQKGGVAIYRGSEDRAQLGGIRKGVPNSGRRGRLEITL